MGGKHSLSQKSLKEPELDYSAKVLRPSLLKKEGTSLMIVPFTAGIGVEANQDLDRLSLMIVKGTIDTLNEYTTPFEILNPQEADRADLIIQGHITYRKNPKARKSWMFRSKETTLSVEAKITERKTGSLVLIYSRQRTAPATGEKKDEEMILAEQIGQDLAKYILGQEK